MAFIETGLVFLCLLAVQLYGEEVTIRTEHTSEQNAFKCVLPKTLKVKIEQAGQGKLLAVFDLAKRDIISSGHHVKIMKRDEDGLLQLDHFSVRDEKVVEIQSYHNHKIGASFLVKCVVMDTGWTYPLLEGSLYLDGQKFRFHHTNLEDKVKFESQGVAVMYIMTSVLEHSASDALAMIDLSDEQESSEFRDPQSEKNTDTRSAEQTLASALLHRKRRSSSTYYIDVLPVVDYSLYSSWAAANRTGGSVPAQLNTYLMNVFTAVDMRLQTLDIPDTHFHARMASPVIASNSSDAPFSESIKYDLAEGVKISAPRLLESFNTWVNEQTSLPKHDHAMLFVAYELIPSDNPNAVLTNITKGLAGVSTLCHSASVSIVEDKGHYQSENVAAHELGHSLGSRHDGENNTCDSADRYIMSIGTFPQADNNLLNPWLFSSCSSQSIATYMTQLESEPSSLNNCLLTQDGQQVDGQNFTITAQDLCERTYGPTAFPCRNFNNFSEICTILRCRTVEDLSCTLMVSAMGTCCGNQKKCIAGHCVDAAVGDCPMDESCPLGDQPSLPLKNYSNCSVIPSPLCYDEDVRKYCCDTCKTYETMIADCPYGDRAVCTGLTEAACQDNKTYNSCCGSCFKLIPQQTAPSTPATTEPQSTAPQSTASQSIAPQSTAPQSTAPQSTAPVAVPTTEKPTDINQYGFKPPGFFGCYLPPCAASRHFCPGSLAALMLLCLTLIVHIDVLDFW